MTGDTNINEPETYKLLGRPIFIKILENMRSLTGPLSKKAAEAFQDSDDPDLDITPEIAYHNSVFHYASNLIDAISRMEEVPIYLRRFPTSKYFNENGITLHKWINYHYSSYLVVVVSLYDIALLLTNAVFALGINPRFCNKKKVAKNEFVRKTEVKMCLDKLSEAIDDYRETRHLYVHRGSVPKLEFLDQLESIRHTSEAMDELELERIPVDIDNPLTSPYFVKDMYRYERRKLITQVMQMTDSFVEILIEFLDSLYPVYQVFSKHWTEMPPTD